MAGSTGSELREWVRFVLFTIFVAIVYGICRDLIAAHLCPEYFLPPFHAKLVNSSYWLTLAFVWGVAATWWVGVGAGLILGLANRKGAGHRVAWSELRRRVLAGFIVVWFIAMLALVLINFGFQRMGGAHASMLAVATAHTWSYMGSGALILWIAVQILTPSKKQAATPTKKSRKR